MFSLKKKVCFENRFISEENRSLGNGKLSYISNDLFYGQCYYLLYADKYIGCVVAGALFYSQIWRGVYSSKQIFQHMSNSSEALDVPVVTVKLRFHIHLVHFIPQLLKTASTS